MAMIRTPEERFSGLRDYPFAPHWFEFRGMRVHYLDEGSGPVVLCLHGEPSWSYLYRKMIPKFSAGHRVVCPDFIGFGKSDKYTETAEYNYELHREMLAALIEHLDLRGITAVVQDWGGLIGLRVATMLAERFSRLVIMNTGLPNGVDKVPWGFHVWRTFAAVIPEIPVGLVMRLGTATHLSREVVAAYEAPFPDGRYKAGAKIWPALVPVRTNDQAVPDMNAAREGLAKWDKPALVMFGDRDFITRPLAKFFRELIPTAQEQPEIWIRGAGHFLQEDRGEEIADRVLEFMARTV